jgi:hypothetical protein
VHCFHVLLQEVEEFTTAADMTGISRLLSECIVFVQRAYVANRAEAGIILFGLCNCLVHCKIAALAPAALKVGTEQYLRKIEDLSKDLNDKKLTARLWARRGEVLRCYGGHDRRTLLLADALLRGCLDQNDFQNRRHAVIRDRTIVGARVAGTEAEFAKLVAVSEQSLDAWDTLQGRRCVLHSIAEAYAYRAGRTQSRVYRQKALAYYEQGMALDTSSTPTEISLRIKGLPLVYASHGITDLIGDAEQQLRDLLRLASLAGSVRFAHNLDASAAALRAKKVIPN